MKGRSMSNQPPTAPPPGQGHEDDLPPWRQQPSRSGWISDTDGPEDYEPLDDTAFTEHGLPPGLNYTDPVVDDDMQLPYEAAPPTSPRYSAQPSAWLDSDTPVVENNRARPDTPATVTPRQEVRPSRTGQEALKVGLWGSPQSGKTTYLAALRHAIGTASRANIGSWNIYPLSDPSAELLIRFTHELVSERKFPEATDVGAVVPLEWLFVGDLASSRFAPRRSLFRRAAGHDSRFVLDLVDVSGKAFGDETEGEVSPDVVTRAIDHLAAANGLIYLFDPVTEKEEKNASNYVNRTITGLSQRLVRRGSVERYLPHQVSVCITKFDHPEVFQQARRAGLVNYGPDGLPRVLDEHAEQFFDALCDGRFWGHRDERGEAGAQFIRDTLKNSFHPANIRYFVTSSIGFWHPPGWNGNAATFDPEFFANFNEIGNGQMRIKGPIHPINVLEPLVFLHQRLARAGMSRR